jgi:Tfp pilus assembly protein PilX
MTPNHRTRKRSGYSIIAVLALMGLAGGLFVGWTRNALRGDRQTRIAHEHAQAEQLASAALSRAAARLAQDPEYQGESWRLAPDELGQSYAAFVTIAVTGTGDDGGARQATARVELPPGENRRVLHTQSLKLPNLSEGES